MGTGYAEGAGVRIFLVEKYPDSAQTERSDSLRLNLSDLSGFSTSRWIYSTETKHLFFVILVNLTVSRRYKKKEFQLLPWQKYIFFKCLNLLGSNDKNFIRDLPFSELNLSQNNHLFTHAEKSFRNIVKSSQKLDCIYHFPQDLEPNESEKGNQTINV